MKNFLLLMATIALCPAATLFGQTFTGTWQGTLKIPRPPGELRIVFKITAAEKGTLQAESFSIDQSGRPTRYTSVTQSGSTIRMTLAGPNPNYDGTLSLDGSTLTVTGDWDLGTPTAVILTKATPETAWTIPEPPPPLVVMNPKAKPEFEVATIKPSQIADRPGYSFVVNNSGILNSRNTSLMQLIKFAYNVHLRQVSGAPAWAQAEKFDITAKPDKPGMPNGDQLAAMLQKLLADRFGLVIHREKKQLSAYVITVAKDGPKIAKAPPNSMTLPGYGGRPSLGFNVRNATMADFSGILQDRFTDQPVVDQTGLGDQRYDFVLKWTPDPSQNAEPQNAQPQPDADAPPDLFTAMQQQLGLQMKSGRAPVDVLIVDRVEKPSAN
jgi:uncharacterized protein (TIGR03435 family)